MEGIEWRESCRRTGIDIRKTKIHTEHPTSYVTPWFTYAGLRVRNVRNDRVIDNRYK
jgi:hypothetical protein